MFVTWICLILLGVMISSSTWFPKNDLIPCSNNQGSLFSLSVHLMDTLADDSLGIVSSALMNTGVQHLCVSWRWFFGVCIASRLCGSCIFYFWGSFTDYAPSVVCQVLSAASWPVSVVYVSSLMAPILTGIVESQCSLLLFCCPFPPIVVLTCVIGDNLG